MVELRYVDHRKIFFPILDNYPNGLKLPNESNIVKVSDREKKSMLLKRNGKNPCFEEVKKERRKKENNGGD